VLFDDDVWPLPPIDPNMSSTLLEPELELSDPSSELTLSISSLACSACTRPLRVLGLDAAVPFCTIWEMADMIPSVVDELLLVLLDPLELLELPEPPNAASTD